MWVCGRAVLESWACTREYETRLPISVHPWSRPGRFCSNATPAYLWKRNDELLPWQNALFTASVVSSVDARPA